MEVAIRVAVGIAFCFFFSPFILCSLLVIIIAITRAIKYILLCWMCRLGSYANTVVLNRNKTNIRRQPSPRLCGSSCVALDVCALQLRFKINMPLTLPYILDPLGRELFFFLLIKYFRRFIYLKVRATETRNNRPSSHSFVPQIAAVIRMWSSRS